MTVSRGSTEGLLLARNWTHTGVVRHWAPLSPPAAAYTPSLFAAEAPPLPPPSCQRFYSAATHPGGGREAHPTRKRPVQQPVVATHLANPLPFAAAAAAADAAAAGAPLSFFVLFVPPAFLRTAESSVHPHKERVNGHVAHSVQLSLHFRETLLSVLLTSSRKNGPLSISLSPLSLSLFLSPFSRSSPSWISGDVNATIGQRSSSLHHHGNGRLATSVPQLPLGLPAFRSIPNAINKSRRTASLPSRCKDEITKA